MIARIICDVISYISLYLFLLLLSNEMDAIIYLYSYDVWEINKRYVEYYSEKETADDAMGYPIHCKFGSRGFCNNSAHDRISKTGLNRTNCSN